ncbi:hypothetical protein C8R43DRAFT_1025067 [Mycena crocata]|nr:hypothetical protein C8R43DRAFT_1025067 [Mycena crocata]
MELPQDLIYPIIDAIVDKVDLNRDPWDIGNTHDVLESLRSCALVARAFVRPCQTYIFHGISLSDEKEIISPRSFSALLTNSPHLGSHVRALFFEHGLNATVENLEPIMHTLASVTNLVRLDISPDSSQGLSWQSYPAALRASFISVFALPYLRHITLWYFEFHDAAELQAILRGSTSLKTLVLRSTTFNNTEQTGTSNDNSPTVVLDSLQLYFMDATQIQAMLDSFTSIDITHLRHIYLHNTPMCSLLRVNAATIQKLTVRAYFPDHMLEETVDEDALAGAYGLQFLNLKMPFLPSLSKMIRRFGDLGHLTHLQAITITVSQKALHAEWEELDGLLGVLGELPSLADVSVYSRSPYSHEDPYPEALLRKWMPRLAGRGVLRIHDSFPED